MVTRARAYWSHRLTAAGALPCSKCRRPVTPDHRWQVDHLIPRGLGGDLTDPANQWIAHGRCNESAGSKVRVERRAARAGDEPLGAMPPERLRGIRGI